MSAFRKVREKHSFLEICDSVELSTEVSWLPLKAYELDASIVFSDILIPIRALGTTISFGEEGPVISAPKTEADLKKLRTSFDPQEDTPVILKTISELRRTVAKEKAVLGFAGAPFTMLSYLLEGKLTKDLSIVKRWMFEKPEVVHQWLDYLAVATGKYLDAQVEAGADAVQLFDTWAGALSVEDYQIFALPYARKALSLVTSPSIYYVNGVSAVLDFAASVGAQCLSVDWRMNLSEARRRVPQVMAIQGNLDPLALHLPKAQIRERVLKMCESYGYGPGHIVNLGHGIVPSIPEDAVKVFIDSVHEFRLKA